MSKVISRMCDICQEELENSITLTIFDHATQRKLNEIDLCEKHYNLLRSYLRHGCLPITDDHGPKRFYVYALFNENDEPFYIGKGCHNRFKMHFIPSQLTQDTDKVKEINRIIKETGFPPKHKILYFHMTEEEALTKERELIAEIGLENLTNVLSGGYTQSGDNNPFYGKQHTEETKKLIGDYSKNRDPSVYKKISIALTGNTNATGYEFTTEELEKIRSASTKYSYSFQNNFSDDIYNPTDWKKFCIEHNLNIGSIITSFNTNNKFKIEYRKKEDYSKIWFITRKLISDILKER